LPTEVPTDARVFFSTPDRNPSGSLSFITITADGDAYTLAHDAAGALRDLRLLPSANGRVLSWSVLVAQQQETWPVQYVFPGGAYIR